MRYGRTPDLNSTLKRRKTDYLDATNGAEGQVQRRDETQEQNQSVARQQTPPPEIKKQIMTSPTNKIMTSPANKLMTSPTNKIMTSPTNKIMTSSTNKLMTSPTNKIMTSPTNKVGRLKSRDTTISCAVITIG
jgi:hypothetical protein